jgi:hypothetical protein
VEDKAGLLSSAPCGASSDPGSRAGTPGHFFFGGGGGGAMGPPAAAAGGGGGADVYAASLYAGSGAAVQVRKESLHGDLAWAFGTVSILALGVV